ncbi:MAG: response regulator [Archaeoglobus sp.]|nr:response regulator [Archaeoglobus sp.]
MIVDDESAIRDIIKLFLGVRYQFIDARDGVEAIELYEKERPDLVIMDIRMPRMNGVEAIKKIKDRFPDAKIIVLSAYAAGKTQELKEAGATAILEKPLRRGKVLEAVNELL